MDLLKNKVAIITGASSGFGLGTALKFASEGCNLIITARNEQKLKQIEENAQGAHHEPGDPNMAAKIIFEQIINNFDHLPLRLPLGKFASQTAINKYQENLEAFQKLASLSNSADKPEKKIPQSSGIFLLLQFFDNLSRNPSD